MKARARILATACRWTGLWAAAAVAAVGMLAGGARAVYIEEVPERADRGPEVRPWPPRPPVPPMPPGHVPELARYLDRIDLGRPLTYGRLAVWPVLMRGAEPLGGRWLTMDEAIRCGRLVVTEKGEAGSVPWVVMENRSRDEHVFVMAGELVSGGKQARTVREDVVLAPGQRVEVPVWCVEQHRWAGKAEFAAPEMMVPQSIQREMRKGAGQEAVWAEVARRHADLGVSSPTADLAEGYKAAPVRRELDEVRRVLVPEMPRESVGFVFADRWARRPLGAEFFGRSDLARALLPKLLDAYAVDLVVREGRDRGGPPPDAGVAWDLVHRIRAAGSFRAGTPGSGAGIRLRGAGLVGDGVGLADDLVHFGCQTVEVVPLVRPDRPGADARRERD